MTFTPSGLSQEVVSDIVRERQEAMILLREVAESAVGFQDDRIRWIEVQIDRDVWDRIQKLVKP